MPISCCSAKAKSATHWGLTAVNFSSRSVSATARGALFTNAFKASSCVGRRPAARDVRVALTVFAEAAISPVRSPEARVRIVARA